MLQSLVTLLFSLAAIGAAGLLVLLVRADWALIRDAIGIGPVSAAPLPPHIRRLTGVRATMIRISPCALRRAA